MDRISGIKGSVINVSETKYCKKVGLKVEYILDEKKTGVDRSSTVIARDVTEGKQIVHSTVGPRYST